MKSILKIGFTDTFDGTKTFFTHLFEKRYTVIRDDVNPDYLIFGDRNFGGHNTTFNNKNCIKIFFTGENERPWDYHCHFAMCFEHLENEKCIRFPHYVIYEFDHHILGRHIRKSDDSEEIRDKDFCSFIQKNPNAEKRNWYFHELSKYKQVVAAGPLFNNTGGVTPVGVTGKVDCMSKFKFNLCFENSAYPGYLTERLYEALCAKTIPIYWGSGTAGLDFNPKAFLNWHDYRNDEEFIKAIIELDQNEEKYMEMYMQPMFNNNEKKNKYFYDEYILDWFDKNVYKGVINGQ